MLVGRRPRPRRLPAPTTDACRCGLLVAPGASLEGNRLGPTPWTTGCRPAIRPPNARHLRDDRRGADARILAPVTSRPIAGTRRHAQPPTRPRPRPRSRSPGHPPVRHRHGGAVRHPGRDRPRHRAAAARRAQRCLREGHRDIDVDLSRVTSCDASGLHVFLDIYHDAARAGGYLRLHRPSPIVARLLTLTGTGTLLFGVPPRPPPAPVVAATATGQAVDFPTNGSTNGHGKPTAHRVPADRAGSAAVALFRAR
ncbi:STAS domain-containing protein [Streptomycetaceae bacterium NBC_01309]